VTYYPFAESDGGRIKTAFDPDNVFQHRQSVHIRDDLP
jgi:hypothetical protein